MDSQGHGVQRRGRLKLNQEAIDGIRPFLEAQDYIKEVKDYVPAVDHACEPELCPTFYDRCYCLEASPDPVDYNLDHFRHKLSNLHHNLCQAHLDKFVGGDVQHHMKPWFKWEPESNYDIVVCRSARYHNNYGWWELNKKWILPRAVFIGHHFEHEMFEFTFRCTIPYVPTTLVEAADMVAGCQVYIGNQTSITAIAHGLGKRMLMETYKGSMNCMFQRDNAEYF